MHRMIVVLALASFAACGGGGQTSTPTTPPAPPPLLNALTWLDIPEDIPTIRVGQEHVVIVRLSAAIEADVTVYAVPEQVAVEGLWLRAGVLQMTITGVGEGADSIDLVAEHPGYETAEASFFVNIVDTTAFYLLVSEWVERYWSFRFPEINKIYVPIVSFQGYDAPGASACGLLDANNAIYCTIDSGVYYDTKFMDKYYDEIGPMGTAFIIGHEIGHHVSWQIGWRIGDAMSKKQNELQADCFSGAWARSVDELVDLEPEEIQEATEAIISVGSPAETWFDPNYHGTAIQRLSAFYAGFRTGPRTCMDPAWVYQWPVI